MTSDLFTKNLAGPLFDYHAQSFVGYDEYMIAKGDVQWTRELDHTVTREGRVSESPESQSWETDKRQTSVESRRLENSLGKIDNRKDSMERSEYSKERSGDTINGGNDGINQGSDVIAYVHDGGFTECVMEYDHCDVNWEHLRVWANIVVL